MAKLSSMILLSTLFLVGVAFGQNPQASQAQRVRLRHLYNFTGGADGGAVFGGVARDHQGNLYGVTEIDDHDQGYGTVYELSPAKRGYSFRVLADFSLPIGEECENTPVVDEVGNVFGICPLGGESNGTIWEYSRSGKLKVVHFFMRKADGYWPDDIVRIGPDLYGTTAESGPGGGGTLWKYSPRSREFTLLHGFTNGADGGSPGGPTIDHKGILWGITVYGPNCYDCGAGTVWNYDPGSQTFTTVLDFNTTAISTPQNNFVVDERGNLFGTAFPLDGSNYGMIYELEAENNYAPVVLYTFTEKQRGWGPGQLSLDKHGNLIGTTYLGGKYGGGTVYELGYKDGPEWQQTILHSFNEYDGSSPLDGVTTDYQGNWFGTTVYGGKYGWGEVFELSGVP